MAKSGKKAARGGRGPGRPTLPRSSGGGESPSVTPVNWQAIKSNFPVKRRTEANAAADLLLAVPASDPDYWRAQAWFAYLCATAVLDWWDFSGGEWKDWAGLPRQTFWNQAARLADEAVRNTNKSDLYDALWARGFIAVAEGRFADAMNDYYLAITIGGDKKDAAISAEAADAAVFAGDLVQARAWIDAAFDLVDGTPPNGLLWFYWVRAWVAVAEGVQFPAGSNERIAKAEAAIRDLDLLGNPVPAEFDAAITRLLAVFLQNGQFDEALWNSFKTRVDTRKNMIWNRHLELARSPFKIDVPAAMAVRNLIRDVIP